MLFLRKIVATLFMPELQLIFPPKRTILLFALILSTASVIVPFFFFPAFTALLLAVVLILFSSLMLVLLVEVWFRLAHKKVYGFKYKFVANYPDRDNFFYEPHPFISYVRRRNFRHKDAPEHSNNFRASFPPGQARNLAIPKPPGQVRINCLGASETAFFDHNGQREALSYPLALEGVLKEKFPKLNLEVNNLSTAGYTSVEILVEFLLNSFDSQPDIVIIYHGYNDIRAFLTPGFSPDYSHFRRNFAAEYERMRIVNRIPFIPLNFYNFLLWDLIPNRLMGTDVHYAVTKGKMDIDAKLVGLNTYQRNIEHIINICKANGIQVILSTFCHFFDENSRADPERLKWERKVREVVTRENEVMRNLARTHGLPLVDNFNLIPQDKKFFRDKIHFTLEGMQQMAINLAEPIIKLIHRKAVDAAVARQN